MAGGDLGEKIRSNTGLIDNENFDRIIIVVEIPSVFVCLQTNNTTDL